MVKTMSALLGFVGGPLTERGDRDEFREDPKPFATSTSRPIGQFQVALMLEVIADRSNAFGTALADRLEQKLGKRIYSGQVFTALSRLEERGLLASTEARVASNKGARTRQLYTVTKEGLNELKKYNVEINSVRDST